MRVKSWVAAGDTPLAAVMVNVKVPSVDSGPRQGAGAVSVVGEADPLGQAALAGPVETLRATDGGLALPVVIVNVPLVPVVKVVLSTLVMLGALPVLALTSFEGAEVPTVFTASTV